jgi:hypothetical protein
MAIHGLSVDFSDTSPDAEQLQLPEAPRIAARSSFNLKQNKRKP